MVPTRLALKWPSPAFVNAHILPGATGALAIGIFVADALTDAEIAAGVLYVAVVLLSDRFYSPRGVLRVGLGCMALSVVGQLISPGDLWGVSAPSNTLLSLGAIGATTLLVLRNRRAQDLLHQARAELERVTRVTTMGELVASITHEINQPLTGVVTNGDAGLRWLNQDKPDLDEARNALSRIVSDGKRAGEVIRGLRALAKKSGPQLTELVINDAIREVLALTRSELQRHGVVLHIDLSAADRPVLGDRVQLQQVLLNLIMNGVEAMSAVTDRPKMLAITSEAVEPGGLLVAVEDTGTGLDPATADRIFDPFFTTKPEGMGMGLSICRSIIEDHGGRLWATPNIPQGAIFRFRLPVDGEEVS
jgi:C4-dicarboxylate-specific signal transduction histidine kinase